MASLLLGLAAGPLAAAQQSAQPPGQQQDAPAEKADAKAQRNPRRLVLDIEKHVEKKLEQEAQKGPPRFETSVEVVAKTPQVLLERFFGGVDLECGPAGAPPGGAPTVEEMRAFRPHTSPTADLLALASALAGQVGKLVKKKGDGPARYYLYKVIRKDAVSYALREDRVPDSWFYNFPDLSFELVESFSDKDDAVRGWRRMERGYATAIAPKTQPASSWAAVNCRPRRD